MVMCCVHHMTFWRGQAVTEIQAKIKRFNYKVQDTESFNVIFVCVEVFFLNFIFKNMTMTFCVWNGREEWSRTEEEEQYLTNKI